MGDLKTESNIKRKMMNKVYKFSIQKIKNVNVNIFIYEKLKFKINRFYFLTNLKKNTTRAGHSHKKLKQVYIATNGALEIYTEYKGVKKKYILNNPKIALYLDTGVWREIKVLENNSILCVLASNKYQEKDYIRNYNEFKKKD